MAEAKQVKIPKAKLYKMVSYKGSVGSGAAKYTPLTAAKAMGEVQVSVKSLISGINSLGATLNSVALTTEKLAESLGASISEQVRQADKVFSAQEKARNDEKKKQQSEIAQRRKDEARKKRDESEDLSEKKKPKYLQNIKKSFAENTKKAFGGLFGTLAKIAGFFLKYFVVFGLLDWMAKNPEKVQRLAKGLAALGKFIYKVASFLVGSAFDGLTKFLENPISLKGFFGAVQFVLSAAPLFVGMAFLKNPVATTKAVFSLLKLIGGGMMNMMKAGKTVFGGKFGKIAGVVGAGAATAMAIRASGGSDAEAVGGGVGAGAGTAIGQALGSKFGPAGSAIGGAVGGLAGGAIGKAVGPMLAPLTKPIGDFFKMIGDVFNAAIAPLKDGATEFFKALGGFMSGILDAIKPHLPFIKKVVAMNMKIAFFPLLMGIKALTALLKFFTPKKAEDAGKKPEGKAAGGRVSGPVTIPEASVGGEIVSQTKKFIQREESFFVELIDALMEPDGIVPMLKQLLGIIVEIAKNPMGAAVKIGGGLLQGAWNAVTGFLGFAEGGAMRLPQRAGGGWIQGPQSGYPVSLDGGNSVSFIGHGTEWVGTRGFAQGGAFVVPFDTPATRRNPGLTSMRMRQAAAGGYGMPGFSLGGAVRSRLKKYAEGGKVQFSPGDYNKGSITSDRLTVGDKGYIVRYKEDAGNVTVLQMNKIVKDNFFRPDDLTGVPPGPEWEGVVNSSAFKQYLSKKHGTSSGMRDYKTHTYNLKGIKTHENASLAYRYNQSFQQFYNDWRNRGYSHEDASAAAASAAKELAVLTKNSKGQTVAALPGAKDTATGEELAGVAPAEMRNVDITPPSSPDAPAADAEKDQDPMSMLEKSLEKFGKLMTDANNPDAIKEYSGFKINQAKLKEEENKAKIWEQTAAMSDQDIKMAFEMPPIVSGGGGEEQPLVIPNWDKLESTPFITTKFGLVADFNNDMVDLM